jgi:hypothetical protein
MCTISCHSRYIDSHVSLQLLFTKQSIESEYSIEGQIKDKKETGGKEETNEIAGKGTSQNNEVSTPRTRDRDKVSARGSRA